MKTNDASAAVRVLRWVGYEPWITGWTWGHLFHKRVPYVRRYPQLPGVQRIWRFLSYIGGVVFSTFHLLFGKVNLIKYFKWNYVHCKINTYISIHIQVYIFILFTKFLIYYKNHFVTNLTFKRNPLIKY